MKPTTNPSSTSALLLDLLVAQGLLQEEKIKSIEKFRNESRCSVEEAVVETAHVSTHEIARIYAEHFSIPLFCAAEIETRAEDPEINRLIGEKFLRENDILPLGREEDVLTIAMARPSAHDLLIDLEFRTGLAVRPGVAPLDLVRACLDRQFGERDMIKEITEELGVVDDPEEEEDSQNLLNLDEEVKAAKDTHVVRLVSQILRGAITDKASDIHLEPTTEHLKVRLRIDGVLQDFSPVPKAMGVPFISRLKVLAKMDIAEKRIPQDGAISVIFRGKSVDFRVSTCPTIWGEKMVIRILNKDSVPLDLEWMGMEKRQQEDFTRAANSANGVLLVTGPTGSGKTTTLYATLNMIRTSTRNLCTAEDPVEYRFPGINQVHVKPKVGLTFPAVLRSFLRQDPDVIMVGEIRDQETAEICLRAALTGHFVLSTLHTNSALAAITRLEDIGIEPFLISTTLRLVQAQRLVRRLCKACKQPLELDASVLKQYSLGPQDVIYRPKGCDLCRNQGYEGRVAVFEAVPIMPVLAELIMKKAPLSELEAVCRKEGILLLETHGMERVRQGVTSIEEIRRVIIGEE